MLSLKKGEKSSCKKLLSEGEETLRVVNSTQILNYNDSQKGPILTQSPQSPLLIQVWVEQF